MWTSIGRRAQRYVLYMYVFGWSVGREQNKRDGSAKVNTRLKMCDVISMMTVSTIRLGIARHRHPSWCRQHWHSGISHLSPVLEHSSTGLGLFNPIPYWFRHFFYIPVPYRPHARQSGIPAFKKKWSRDIASQEQRMVGLKSYGAQRWLAIYRSW